MTRRAGGAPAPVIPSDPPPRPEPSWQPRPPRRGTVSLAAATALVAVSVLAGVSIGRTLPSSVSSPQALGRTPGTTPSPASPFGGQSGVGGGSTGTGGTGPADVSAIAARIAPRLVDIDTNLSYQGLEAAGTGIVLSADGLVLTNNHVINGATSIRVTDIGNGRTYTGAVVGYDETADVALVRLQGASGLAVAPIASAAPHVGQDVVAVGNAGGKGGTPTAAGGTVTALDQSITASDTGDGTTEQLSGLIQVDADVQPGDSGGSLVDTQARVLGVDTAASQTFSFATSGSQGFAIPIATALRIVHAIEAGHASDTIHVGPTAFIGITASPQTCQSPGSAPGTSIAPGSGALVCKVEPGTAAAGSGLAAGDVITSLDGTHIDGPAALTHLLVRYHPGQRVTVGYTNPAGAHRSASVVLGSGPPG